VKGKKLKPEHARFLPADASAPADRVALHRGSVRWNAYRKCLGAARRADRRQAVPAGGRCGTPRRTPPRGPFARAVKVLTHDRQSFYNPVHHDFLDRDGGRVIHFEGTYTNDFSGNPDPHAALQTTTRSSIGSTSTRRPSATPGV